MLRHMAHYFPAFTLPASKFHEAAAAETLEFRIPCKKLREMQWHIFCISIQDYFLYIYKL